MGDTTGISWAHKTFNGWKGCRKWSPACRFCYAERDTKRWGMDVWGATKPRLITSDAYWRRPLSWNRKAAETGETTRVFAFSWADVFEDHPDVVDARQQFFDLIEKTPALTWMLLTKRPENIAEFAVRWAGGWPPNVWLGTSAETQRYADERIPHLLAHPAAVRYVSVGPTLGLVDLTRIPRPTQQQPEMVWDVLGKRYGVPGHWQAPMSRGVDWVITEGESGRKAGIRPSHPDWFRDVRDQCVAAGVAYHHKQNGEWVARDQVPAGVPTAHFQGHDWERHPQRHIVLARAGARKPVCEWNGKEDRGAGWVHLWRLGREPAGRLLDGEVWAQFPDEKLALAA